MKSFAYKLRARRAALGWNTKRLADHLTASGIDVSARTIEGWEQARREPERFKQEAVLRATPTPTLPSTLRRVAGLAPLLAPVFHLFI